MFIFCKVTDKLPYYELQSMYKLGEKGNMN